MGLTCGIYCYVDIRSVFFYQSIIHVLEGAYFVRESPEKKLLIHNNINYYCEHFVCNLGSAAYVCEKKESEHEATVKFAYQELCEQVFLSNLTIFVSLLNKGFKKPLSCRIVASCLM